ncbi:MAG: SpoIIE family protein phosphatase, partial [Planctomycetota bacterium]
MKDINEVNERGFGDILSFINAGVYITDTERRIVLWNKGAEQITGYSAEEVMGRRCADNVMAHRDKEGRPLCTTDLCPLWRTMQRATPTEQPIVVYITSKSGETLPLSTSIAPVFDDEGNVIGGVEVFRDERENIREMELARRVQHQMLTDPPPGDGRVTFDVYYALKDLIGGDFYHLRQLGEDEFVMFVGDAAGHGASAALYTALIYALIMECQDYLGDPAELMAALNERACRRAAGLGFTTAVAATVDARTGALSYCSAGHPPLLLQRADGGGIEQLSLSHLPLGVKGGVSYENAAAELAGGDRLFAYTDGATDVRVGGEERLGIGGLADLLARFPPEPGHRLTALYDELLRRSADIAPEDDIMLVSCLFH